MKAIRCHSRHLAVVMVAIVCLAAAAIIAAPSAEDLCKQAREQYARHNYKSALALADKALAASPEGKVLRTAQRLKALSMCSLPDKAGYAYAIKIMGEHKPFEKDAELWMAMGNNCARRGPRKNAYESYMAAGKLYEKSNQDPKAADAYFKAADMLRRDYRILTQPAQQIAASRPWNSTEKRRHHVEETIKLYEHIVTLKIKADRKGQALYLAGEHAIRQGDWKMAERSIALFRRCVKEFARTPHAPKAQYQIAETYMRFNKFVEAIKEYQLVFENFPGSKDLVKPARDRIGQIKAPRIWLQIQKSYLPGQTAKVFWQIRNVKKLHLKARSVDLTEAVGKMQRVNDALTVLANMQGDVAANWTFATPDAGKHQYHQHVPGTEKQTTLPIDVPLKKAGAYIVEAGGTSPDGKTTKAYCLVVLSNIAAAAKADGDQVLVFANDARDGTPAAGADVAVARHWGARRGGPLFDHATGKINDAGLADVKMPRRNSCNWIVAVKKGKDQALCARGSYSWSWWGYRQQYKVYGFTERPVYRPGHTVHFKQIIRGHKNGVYTNAPNTKVQVSVRNPKGETSYSRELVTDEFGSVEGDFKLKDKAPLGLYYFNVTVAGRNYARYYAQGNRFRVEEYKKPEFKVTVEPAKPDYRVGDDMKIKIKVAYYFGQPVAGAEVRFTVRKQNYTHRYEWPRRWKWYYEDVYYTRRWGRRRPWWRPRFNELVTTGTAKTDENGEAFVAVKAEPIKGHEKLDLKFIVSTEVTDPSRRVIRGKGEVKVTHAPFFVYPKGAQRVYGPGDSVEINVKTENPSGQGVAGRFTVEAWRVRRVRGVEKDAAGKETVKFEEKLIQKIHTQEIKIPKTGRGSLRFTPDVTGRMKIIIRQVGPKKDRKPVEGSCFLWIASKTGAEAHYAYNDLKIVPAKDQWEIGQKMRVLVNSRFANSRVLLTGEADDLLFSQVVHVKKNSKMVTIDVGEKLCPNFRLTATLLRDNRLLMDIKEIVVPPTHKFIKVTATLDKGHLGGGQDNKFQPREKTTVRVKLTDMRTGKPVAGQVTLMMVDSSVYYIQPEFRQSIEKAFYGHTRRVRVQTTNSFVGPASLNPRGYYRGQRRRGYARGMGMGQGMGEAMPDSAAPSMRPLAKSALRMGKGGEAAPPAPKLAETIIREHFRDTVLWAGSVVTDADGTGKVPVTMPDQLTTFALHAISFDKTTRVGQVRADAITTKRIIVRLESGRFFTEGDHSYVTVIAHNYYDQPQKLKIDLKADDILKLRRVKLAGKWRDYKKAEELDVTVPAGGHVRLDFQTTADAPGEVTMLARARGVRESDAIKLTKPIVPWGAKKIVASGGAMRGGKKQKTQTAEFTIDLPEKIGPNSQSLTVTLNPSVAALAMESLPYLAAYPYGCVEQTMSRFLPTVVMRKTLQDAGVSLDDIRKHVEQQMAKDPKLAGKYKLRAKRMRHSPVYSAAEVDKMIAAGLSRLGKFQHGDGGWGWWRRGASDPYMTAYVMYGLLTARGCDVKISAGMIDRGVAFLTKQAEKPKLKEYRSWWHRHMDNDNTRAFMLYVIGRAKPGALKAPKLRGHLNRIYKGRDDLTDYGRAYLALAMHAAGRKKEAGIIVENFENTVTIDKGEGDAHWGAVRGWWHWYHGATETTSWVLQAMLEISPKDKHVPLAVNWLVRNRREVYWYNTKTTAMAVYALARYAKVAGELDCDQTYEVVVDGQVSRTVRITKENMFTFDDWIVLGPQQIAPGKHKVKIVRKGKGSLYWGGFLRYYDKSDVIKASGHRIALERKYFRLVPEKFMNTRRVWKGGKSVTEKFPDIRHKPEPLPFGAEIASGQLIEVRIGIEAKENLEYMLFEDAKPSGCEPYRLVSGASYGGGVYANMELRDTKVVFFANWLRKGKRTLSYKLVCEQPGTFRILPTFGEAMYSPFVQAISDSGKLTITTKPNPPG